MWPTLICLFLCTFIRVVMWPTLICLFSCTFIWVVMWPTLICLFFIHFHSSWRVTNFNLPLFMHFHSGCNVTNSNLPLLMHFHSNCRDVHCVQGFSNDSTSSEASHFKSVWSVQLLQDKRTYRSTHEHCIFKTTYFPWNDCHWIRTRLPLNPRHK